MSTSTGLHRDSRVSIYEQSQSKHQRCKKTFNSTESLKIQAESEELILCYETIMFGRVIYTRCRCKASLFTSFTFCNVIISCSLRPKENICCSNYRTTGAPNSNCFAICLFFAAKLKSMLKIDGPPSVSRIGLRLGVPNEQAKAYLRQCVIVV